MKRKRQYLAWLLFSFVAVLVAVVRFPNSYEDIFFYAIIVLLTKDIVFDIILKKELWAKWIEHLPFALMVFILWPLGYVSWLIGILALVDSIADFSNDQGWV